MPELKNTFTGGKMEKDQDERIVPNGSYRDALNIAVSTSEDSDVGAAQNILGNVKVTEAISGPNNRYVGCSFNPTSGVGRYFGTNKHVGAVVDVETDMMYRLVTTAPTSSRDHGVWMDRIVEYDTTARKELPWYKKEKSVLVDIWKVKTKVISIYQDPGCTKTKITVCLNGYQLKPGLRLIKDGVGSEDSPVHIEQLAYSGGTTTEIVLSESITSGLAVGDVIYFHGDRNLNFDAGRKITGINIIDGMLFWTDNYSEPKKVNIARAKKGSNTQLWSNMNEVYLYGNWGLTSDAALSDFDQHTLLIVDDEVVMECNKIESSCPSEGCTDPDAPNYDPSATSDDGSCREPEEPVEGCRDLLACNYDPAAVITGNSVCTYVGECQECDNGYVVPIMDPNDPCNDMLDCFLMHYTSHSHGVPGGFVDDGQRNKGVSCGGTFDASSGEDALNWVSQQFSVDPSISEAPLRAFWYWKTGTLTSLSLSAPFHANNLCVYPLDGFQPTDPLRPDKGSCSSHTHAMKKAMREWDLEIEVNGVWRNHVTFNKNYGWSILNTAWDSWWGYGQFDLNQRKHCIPSWNSIVEQLQVVEGFDGTTLDDVGNPIPLVSINDDFYTIKNILSTGFASPHSGGWGEYVAGGTMGQRSTDIAAGTMVRYRIVPSTLSSPGGTGGVSADPHCAGWHDEGCFPAPGGKFRGTEECPTDNSGRCVVITNSSGIHGQQDWTNTQGLTGYEIPASSPYTNSPLLKRVDPRDIGSAGGSLSTVSSLDADGKPLDPRYVYDAYGNQLGLNSGSAQVEEEIRVLNPGSVQAAGGNQLALDPRFTPVGVTGRQISNINSATTSLSVGSVRDFAYPIINRYTPDTVVNPVRGGFPGDDIEWSLVCRPVYVLEKHITVIRKGPTAPPKVEMFKWSDDAQVGSDYEDDVIKIETSFNGADFPLGTGADGTNISGFFKPSKEKRIVGDLLELPIDWEAEEMDWKVGQNLVIKLTFTNHLGHTKEGVCRAIITTMDSANDLVEVEILAVTRNFPINAITVNDIYTVKAELIPPLFEMKFPKFAYRYKYEDGEYSVFGPWSEIAFMPGTFDYLPKKGYNLGMTNTMRSLKLLDWRPKSMPEDVVSIDLLYKESSSPGVYTVETFNKDTKNPLSTDPRENYWTGDALKVGSGGNFGEYKITSELIHKVLPSNQLLRPWDNVPRVALGQEITANRLIYGNYVQNYDLRDEDGGIIKPNFDVSLDSKDYSIDSITPNAKEPMKSLKSMRTYQIGVVYRDRYGRETPVLTHESGSIELPKTRAKLQNRLSVKMNNLAPDWAESYTFYIKETSNEYYNLSMDRWYDAEDDGIWLSFPSSERNKLSDRSVIMLKKEHNSDRYVDEDIKYKVLSIKNDAPTFVKTQMKFWGSLPMMLPPPGWGTGSKAGTWDTGMFHLTGLPLPMRLYIDVYAEYFDQSVLAGLVTQSDNAGVQVRITQTIGTTSAYVSSPSQSVNKSNWYDVAAINYIGAPAETFIEDTVDASGSSIEREVEVPGQAEQIVRISLERLMGSDMAFCEPGDNLSLSRGLSLEARTKVVRDKSEFEGRFFAKVLRDEALQAHIIEPGQEVLDDTYQVLMSRGVKYLQFGGPGVQDYLTGTSGTTGAGKGKFYRNRDNSGNKINHNYVPIGKRWDLIPSGQFGTKYEYSSFSEFHGPAEYKTSGGVGPNAGNFNGPPQSSGYFPWGPSYSANHMFYSGWFFNSYYDFLKYNRAQSMYTHTSAFAVGTAGYPGPYGFGAVWPNTSTTNNYWPSHGVRDWEPVTCGSCGSLNDNDYTTGNLSTLLDLSTADTGSSGTLPAFEDLGGVNQYMLGCIWGNQEDLLGYSGNSGTGTALNPAAYGVGGGTMPSATSMTAGTGNRSMWHKSTIEKLRENWFLLYYGRDLVDNDWPLGRHNPERWFFDKVGSSKGGSGNGVWNQDDGSGNVVSMMDLAYYGIGARKGHHRSFEMMTHQENEAAFAELMATIGTQFRFKQDPNQTIYTVTKAEIHGEIFNYENSYGSWGYKPSGTSTIIGGGNLGGSTKPPWGSSVVGTKSIAGKAAFISDLFNVGSELTGGAPINYRVRMTITLDKIIGSEGLAYGSANSGFHPLKNHVDADGNCNILGGAKQYYQGVSPKGHPGFPEDIGGTPFSDKFYNLSSYWNTTTAPVNSQSSQMSTSDYNNGQHFGLHERGLNDTAIEIVTPYRGDDADKPMSKNPAIWETEPMEDVGLDIYYAASQSYTTNVRRYRSDENRPDPTDTLNGVPTKAHYYDYGYRGEEMIPVGSEVCIGNSGGCTGNSSWVTGVQGNRIWLNSTISGGTPLTANTQLRFYWKGEGFWYGNKQDDQYIIATVKDAGGVTDLRIKPESHSYKRSLSYFNCYTFSNGVESNRVRDDYNAITIDKGVKASMPLAQGYEEERKGSGLIFSGIYNSTSGVNSTNQFIQAEPITKDLNPVNGSIQKLFARDSDLLTFCENKVFKILAKKDALFNADGNTNITSNAAVLGQAIPFVGEYGISKNPESFASQSYRVYFADKFRGSVLRLSRDGLTPISDAGMKDWFKDNLYNASKIIGSYDDREDQYNISIETVDKVDESEVAYTLSYVEDKKGWESFKSFVHEHGLSHKNVYYTFPSNNYSRRLNKDPWGIPYANFDSANAETYQHNMDLKFKRYTTASFNSSTINVTVGVTPILPGMNVAGDGINTGTMVGSVDCSSTTCVVHLVDVLGTTKTCYVDDNAELIFSSARNNFYEVQHYSQITTLFNRDQGNVKRFKTLNYEGTQSQVIPRDKSEQHANVHEIYDDLGVPHVVGYDYSDDYKKDGWFIQNIKTDMQEGSINEFVNKEGKYFNYIRGEGGLTGNLLDTGDFSLQGLGYSVNVREWDGTIREQSAGASEVGCIWGCGGNAEGITTGALPDIFGNDVNGNECTHPIPAAFGGGPFTVVSQTTGQTLQVTHSCGDSYDGFTGYNMFPVDPRVTCEGTLDGMTPVLGCEDMILGEMDNTSDNYNPLANVNWVDDRGR